SRASSRRSRPAATSADSRPARTASSCGRRRPCTGSAGSPMSWRRWYTPGAAMPRRTIDRPVELSGVGLHTGATTRVSIQPGSADRGVRFRRTDLPSRPEIPAKVAEVEATERRTAIGHGDTTIHTVEHLLAAVVALDLDDL